MSELAAIVLAGGAARRLSGVDKPLLEVGGVPLLRRVLAAVRGADPVIVVGPERDGIEAVRWAREDPPGGGPVAALAAGLGQVTTPRVAVLAGDLAGITNSTVERLGAALDGDGAVLVDEQGHRQWLIGVWRTASLRAAIPAEPHHAALRTVLGRLAITDVAAGPGEAADVDTPEDLDRLR
ncbi:molybdenum cofactor guanylyltransferase [Amycolatopsis endophytica]|uniref:Molybdopterin-guanine dinucleotide biosynthesis protein A n=1 Tax=Amycolatopsis endophytica TaxID=860233 RepID=A0A853B9W2_9PSEU|nr:molybdenum cofactor guanylyltransferase [Amycolatopsis endophytica]NYI92143.1 molybdopterin-guanine dinucleotide biosynthesis protein A [Amycolatopsis endophytica]